MELPTVTLMILVLIALPLLAASYPAQLSYCAYLNPLTTNGVVGYFAATVDTASGLAYYNWRFDLQAYKNGSNGNPVCNLSAGLKYHIHSYWKNASSLSTYGTSSCGAPQTGNHYDALFACSPDSQYNTAPTTLCGKIYRTAQTKYTYGCNSTAFASGKLDACEIGDLSGKFGMIHNLPGTRVFQSTGVIVDPLPPRVLDYHSNPVTITNYTAPWQSLVVHCSDKTRLFCAKFTTNLAPCQALGASFAPPSSDSTTSTGKVYSSSQFGGAVAGASILCLLGGLLAGVMFMRYQTNYKSKSKGENDATESINTARCSDAIPPKSGQGH